MDSKNVQDTIENMLGKNMNIIDCETTTVVSQEELLFINGTPVKLNESDNETLNNVLVTGELPGCNVLNDILIRAGLLQRNFNIETSLTVKSTVVLKEDIQITDNGYVHNTSNQSQENNFYSSYCSEVWIPNEYNCEKSSNPLSSLLSNNKEHEDIIPKLSCSSSTSDVSLPIPLDQLLSTHSININSLSTDSGNDNTNTNCSSSSLYKPDCKSPLCSNLMISSPQYKLVSTKIVKTHESMTRFLLEFWKKIG